MEPLSPAPVSESVVSRFVDAVVTSVSPFRVKLDGDTEALPYAPDALIDPLTLTVSNTVRCEILNGRVVVHGRAGGVSPLAATETVAGILEIATTAETTAGTDDGRAITPAKLKPLADRVTAMETGVGATTRYTSNGLLTTSFATYVTVTITCTGRKLRVDLSATYSNSNSGANRTVDVRLQVDGSTQNEELTILYSPLLSGGATPMNVADTFFLTPSAGSHTFTLQAKASAGSAVTLLRASLVVTEL